MDIKERLAEVDLWIHNCFVVWGGLLPMIPRRTIDESRPTRKDQYPGSLGWWIYQTFKDSYKSIGTPITFRSGRLSMVTLNRPADVAMFGFTIFSDEGDLQNITCGFLEEDLRTAFEDQLFKLLRLQKLLLIEEAELPPPLLVCPECGSAEVTTEHHQRFMVNTGKHYCHSMKTQDHDSPATCLACSWEGERHQLVTQSNLKA